MTIFGGSGIHSGGISGSFGAGQSGAAGLCCLNRSAGTSGISLRLGALKTTPGPPPQKLSQSCGEGHSEKSEL